MHHAVDLRLACDECFFSDAKRWRDVAMQVAIAQMAEGDVAAIREMLLQQGVGDGDQFNYAGNRQRYVVLDVLAFLGFRRGDAFA